MQGNTLKLDLNPSFDGGLIQGWRRHVTWIDDMALK
jgi:hypothetical protein